MLTHLKHKVIKRIEKIPLLQIFIYNNLNYFKFLFPHDKDYYALKLLFYKEIVKYKLILLFILYVSF